MQANRCSSRSPGQKFVISAGKIELPASVATQTDDSEAIGIGYGQRFF